MLDRRPYYPTAYDDDWEDQPAQGWFYKWILGMCLPLALAGYGVHAIVAQDTVFAARHAAMTLHGRNAIAFGIAWSCAAVFVHCHYFWGNVYDQIWFAELGKILAACGFIAGMAFVLVRVGVFGIK